MTSLFVSDLHLRPDRPETVRLFFRFLAEVPQPGQHLYLLGDVFEAWAGTGHLAEPMHADLAARLRALGDAGVKTHFMRGNRDFLVGDDFFAASGAAELLDPKVVTLDDGVPTLLMHGDTLCTDDEKYLAWYRLSRSRDWLDSFLARPYAERLAEVTRLRKVSESAQQQGEGMLYDVNDEAVRETMVQHGVTRLIHGHTHRPARHTFALASGIPAQRWVLTDWDAAEGRAWYLLSDANGLRTVAFA